MLSINGLSAGYKTQNKEISVLRELDLTIPAGGILAVLGVSGCGKSTLIQLLAGALNPQAGTVILDTGSGGQPLSPRTHSIAVIPQGGGLLKWKTLRQNCLLSLELRHIPFGADKKNELDALCAQLGMTEYLGRYPARLSGGQQQRGALIRAFLQQPDLLLMDEPFSALDAVTRREAVRVFQGVWTQFRPATLFVTHSINEALFLGHRVAVLGGGKLVQTLENPFVFKEEPEGAADFKRQLFSLLQPDGEEKV